jgi:sporulation protein YlmC with PRC-barrel domain
MKLKTFAAAAALACMTMSAPALAQDAAVAAGATVYGPDGTEVGTIEQIDGTNVVINTGNMTATLPANVLGAGESGPTIGWNKADLEAAITAEQQKASEAVAAALVPGAQLYSVDGLVVGTVSEVGEDGMVVVEHTSAGPIQLPKDQMTVQGANLTFLATAADLEAAVSAQTGG